MAVLRLPIALLAGALSKYALVFTGGVLAAQQTPRGYFEVFGRERLELALGLWSTLTFALPQFFLAALLSWAVARALAFTFVQAVAFIGGALACMAWFAFPSGLSAETAMAQLAGIYFGNAWHLPAAWASWVGFLVGLAVALTRGPHAAQTEA